MTEGGEFPVVPPTPVQPEKTTEEALKAFSNYNVGKIFEGRASQEESIRKKVTVIEDSEITFDQIGGNTKAKDELRELAKIIKGSKVHRVMGATADRGYLLWGPSGNGKTELARALAHETGAIVVIVNYQDLASKWVNETAENIRKLFEFAREEAKRTGKPVIIFFDEADGLFMSRDSDTAHSMHTTALAALLTEMDGAHTNNDNVYVIGATNHAEGIDPAARRRFEHKIEVPNPNESDRVEILQIHRDKARNASKENGYTAVIFADAHNPDFWKEVADATEGFSGAQLAQVIHRATRLAAAKLQIAMEEVGIEDVDEFLAIYPTVLQTITVCCEEVIAIAHQIQKEETLAIAEDSYKTQRYSGTAKGYFGTERN